MAFQRPTLAELVDRIQADFVSRLDLVGAILRRAMVYVLVRVYAGVAHMLHGHLEFLSRQMFPDISEDEFLVRQAGLFGITKTAAGYARATVQFTGTNGTVIPAGTLLTSSGGLEYETDASATIAAGFVAVAVTAVLAGADSTLTAGVVLTLESPIVGVTNEATVTVSIVDGVDEEGTEGLRTRLLERMADPPHGGNEADYVAWSKEVAGVTRAWVYPLGLGPGTVVVRFVRDNDASPIPSAGEVTEVQTYVDALKPAHATVTVVAPTAGVDVFTLSVTPDTAAVRAAVVAELDDLYLRTAEPGGTILLSAVRTAIGTAAGIEDYTLTVPSADVAHTTNQLPTRGTVTFV